MTDHNLRGRAGLAVTAAVALGTLASTLVGASPAVAAAAPATTHSAVAGLPVRGFDTAMLHESNDARHDASHGGLTMNPKLWAIAESWAKHLAATGDLRDNPDLESQVSHACPSWGDIGENVADDTSTHSISTLTAYMHSAPHKANVLDSHFTQVGIATREGHGREWNVMVFADRC